MKPEEAHHIASLAHHRLVDPRRYQFGETRACFYTMTEDERFVLRTLDGDNRCLVVSACSGHGFKFGALLGEASAATVTGQLDAAKVERWAAGHAS